ncbi:MAG: glycosyltransferase family 4 protein [Dysgonamonadaceae bacterium]|jgi:glycosyltransferase involved in cell wall biosynthesis|nr:glycosyltransferase family 4 protein [Dysgonamonadaceae bacterium]
MKIIFLLPFRKNSPVGGLKIMYEYANRLAKRDHQVTILHFRKKFQKYPAVIYPLTRLLKEMENALFGRWFQFNKKCKLAYIRYVNNDTVPDADAIIYTWWTLGFLVEKLSPSKGVKINLIQDYETWAGGIDKLHQSYNLSGIQNIVIAEYLEEIVSRYTEKKTLLLYNAIDTSKFRVIKEIEKRNSRTVCMLFHKEPRKGTTYGLESLYLVRKEIPDLKAILFGVYDKPENLPEFVEYYKKPKDLCALYNRAAIYFTNSLQEGWALPPAEAMSCGCALICTDIGGHRPYANAQNALLVNPCKPEEMANAIIDLIKHPEKRIRLAKEGNRTIQQFSWNHSVQLLEKYIFELIENQ